MAIDSGARRGHARFRVLLPAADEAAAPADAWKDVA